MCATDFRENRQDRPSVEHGSKSGVRFAKTVAIEPVYLSRLGGNQAHRPLTWISRDDGAARGRSC